MADPRPRDLRERQRRERLVRAQRAEADATAAQQSADAKQIAEVREILGDWDDLVVKRGGPIWSIDGFHKDRRHFGARGDVVALAKDMAAIALRENEDDARAAQDAAAQVEALVEMAKTERQAPPLQPVRVVTIRTPAVMVDPLDPAHWASLEQAKSALLVLVKREAARRLGFTVTLYEQLVELETRVSQGRATRDEELQLRQQHRWAEEGAAVEAAHQAHVSAIGALASLDGARGYAGHVGEGWPELAS